MLGAGTRMKKTMYMMRHGQTLFNIRRKIQGVCDSPLTEEGMKQAQVAGNYFNTIPLDAAYSSTSERCCDTLELITDLPYKRLKGLKEMNFGVFEGESEDLNPKDKSTFFLQYGGESREQVKERVVESCLNIMNADGHQSVLVVSHAGACLHFMRKWMDATEELKKGFTNCCIFKYEFDTEEQTFTLIDSIRPV